MLVDQRGSCSAGVEGTRRSAAGTNLRLRARSARLVTKLLKTGNPVIHSPGLYPSRWPSRVNECDADVVHLHWVQNEMLSIADIGRIKKPLVWTFHDMWAFCGAEHYTTDDRWQQGYRFDNRPPHESGFDLNRWAWQRKLKHWHSPAHVVCPSHWLADCVRSSALMRDWPVSVIPNCIDTRSWCPADRQDARQRLGLSFDGPLMLFGADDGTRDTRKGFDLLVSALEYLRDELPELELLVFGGGQRHSGMLSGVPAHFTGELASDDMLRCAYNASDVMVIPSRQDNLPNTGLESLACGTPVVAFDVGGLSDIVDHRVNGALAMPFDVSDLAEQITWVLRNSLVQQLPDAARRKAVECFGEDEVVAQHLALYHQVVAG